MPATFSTNDDLLIGDITYESSDKDHFRAVANKEIVVALGFSYIIPLTPAVTPTSHIGLLLSRVEALIASGRIIMDRAASGEDDNLHAYGLSLLTEGQGLLMQISNGQIDLIGITKVERNQASGDGPSIINGDDFSGVDAYYAWMNASPFTSVLNPIWTPGRRA